MSKDTWANVERYLTSLLIENDPALQAAIDESAAAGLPPHHVSPNEGKLLMLLARACGARSILEIGTLGGYSTIWLARAIPVDGTVISLELNPQHAEVARRNIARANLAGVVDILVGPAVDSLNKLAYQARAFDLIFIDADKANNAQYLDLSLKLSRPGTLIIVDNVIRGGAVIDAGSRDPSVEGVRRFNERLARDSRLSATAIQTVGSKGYDGFAIALVLSAGQTR